MPEFELHKFGGTIVNSVTIHHFPAGREGTSDEDVMVLRCVGSLGDWFLDSP